MAKNNVWILIILGIVVVVIGMYLTGNLFAVQLRPANQQNVPEGSTAGSGYSSSGDDDSDYSDDNCKSRWKCESWSTCEDGLKTRDCEDLNDCWNENPNAVEKTCGSSSTTTSSSGDRSCGSEGETSCVATNKYKKCLKNLRWSGVLSCPKGTTCGEVGCAYAEPEGDDCTPNWDCDAWEECDSDTGEQTRICSDLNECLNDKTQSQLCNGENGDGGTGDTGCTADWNCGVWGICSNNQQTQSCTDLNSCKQDKVVSQSCVVSSTQCIPILQSYSTGTKSCEYNMGIIYLIIGVIGLIILLSFLK